jgi:hypothetical protein
MQPTFRIGVETFETACNLPQPALPPVVADLDAELNRFAKLGVEELRALWRERRGQEPPEALSKDLTPERWPIGCRKSALADSRLIYESSSPRFRRRRAHAAREGNLVFCGTHLTSMTFASPCLFNKLRDTSRPCRWSLRSRRDLPRLKWFKVT